VTWTFDPTSVSSNLAQVRLTIGDTNTSDQLLTDEEINLRLSDYDNHIINTSVRCVRDILAKLARNYDRNVASFSGSRSQKFQQYKDLLDDLLAQANTSCEAFFGGLSQSEEDSILSDTDYKAHYFSMGMDDNNE